MGEIADDMISGVCCAICGCYFATNDNIKIIHRGKHTENAKLYTHGYPVACWDCWDEDSGYQKAKVDTL
jgi:hypothetical protein